MARRRKRLGARESRPGESRPTERRTTESRPTESRTTESRPTESRTTESRPTESRTTESRPTESRPHVGEGKSNDIPNNATINDNTDETTTENLNNPSNGRKQVQVITKIFKERIDDTGYTWTKVSQPTKNFYFGEFKKHFVWDPKIETRVRKAWDAKASGCYVDFFRDIRAKMVKPIFMSDNAWINFTSHWATSKYKEIQEKKYTKSSKRIRSSYAKAMIELRADVKLKDTIVVAMPKLVGEGFYTYDVRVEYG
nr:hypothetical protein [Tanacetum cinerariifolium]